MDEDVLQLMDFLDGDAECHFSIRPSGQHLQHAATAPPLDRGDSDGWPKGELANLGARSGLQALQASARLLLLVLRAIEPQPRNYA